MTPVLPARDTAYILAGGRSTRFGSDKARAMIEGRPLIRRIADMLESRGHQVVAVAREADQYADLGLNTIADIEPDLGPVGGLQTALMHRADGWIILCSCDLIHPSPEPIQQLEQARTGQEDADAVVYRTDRWQPFPGLYHTRMLRFAGHRSMQGLLDAADTRPVPCDDIRAITQANRPDELPPDAER
ncbi:MAG: molybdenum cofactor guanylyltransferase [Phycisphaerales bacterium]|nr:molybdenum cofactor guanylyltransferase [Phycisphaerales bacterium]